MCSEISCCVAILRTMATQYRAKVNRIFWARILHILCCLQPCFFCISDGSCAPKIGEGAQLLIETLFTKLKINYSYHSLSILAPSRFCKIIHSSISSTTTEFVEQNFTDMSHHSEAVDNTSNVWSRSLREGGETGILMWPLPDYDNTMVTLLKLSPPRRSYQLPQFMLQKSQYALRYLMVYFSSICGGIQLCYSQKRVKQGR